jgi:ribulose-5-phosphate 4-epimerase/fuculose-1-phosphate aldolase
MTETQAREAICRIGKSLFDRGYVHATAGNISIRLDDGFLITPTDACLGFLDPARLAKTDTQGSPLSGDKPSKTLSLHQRIVDAARAFDADTCCVIHTHSTHCVTLTLGPHADELLPALTPYFVMKVGHVPVLPYRRPGAPETAESAADVITRYGQRGTPIRALMLQRLGPNVWHNSPDAAMATLEELEETARLRVLQPGSAPLTDEQIDALRHAFGARW